MLSDDRPPTGANERLSPGFKGRSMGRKTWRAAIVAADLVEDQRLFAGGPKTMSNAWTFSRIGESCVPVFSKRSTQSMAGKSLKTVAVATHLQAGLGIGPGGQVFDAIGQLAVLSFPLPGVQERLRGFAIVDEGEGRFGGRPPAMPGFSPPEDDCQVALAREEAVSGGTVLRGLQATAAERQGHRN